MFRSLAFAAILTALAVPLSAADACSLEMTLSCTSGNCRSTTKNVGANACTGEYFFGFLSADPATKFSNFTDSLGAAHGQFSCFNSASSPGTATLSFVFCTVGSSLSAGASFTTSADVSSPPAAELLAFTQVSDPATRTELAFVYASANGGDQLTCTPHANVPSLTLSGVPYSVTWSAVADPTSTFVIEESTSPDFSTITSTQTSSGTSAQFVHTVTSTTTYYYRVRAVSCNGSPGTNSAPTSIVVQSAPPQNSRGADAPVPLGTETPVDIPLTLTIKSSGKRALGDTSFTASTDKPYLTVTPSSGSIPSSGNVQVVVTATPGSLPPGASSGTVKLTAPSGAVLASSVVSISLVTPVTPSGKTLPPANSLVVPAVRHINSATAPVQSDVRLTNGTTGLQKYQVTFTPTKTDGTQSSKTTTISVDANQTVALNDVARDFFGFGATGSTSDSGFGSIEVRPLSGSSLNYVSSRLFATTAAGTIGQFLSAVPFSSFATNATGPLLPGAPPPSKVPAVLSLQQVAQSTRYQTDLGLVEGSGSPASGTIKIFDDSGRTPLKSVPFSLKPGEHQQLDSFLATQGLTSIDDARIEVTVDSPTGAVTAYASVIDKTTTDSLAITPVNPTQVKATRYVLPGIAELTTATSNFHSDIRVFNGGTAVAIVTPTYYPQNNGTPVAGKAFTINPGEVKRFDDALPSLFDVRDSGGSILLTTPSQSSLVASGRTYSNVGNGTFGQFIPGVTPDKAVTTGDAPLQIQQLEQSQNFRTNIGVAEVGGGSAHVRLTLTLPDSKVAPSTELDLSPNEFVQLNRIIESMNPGKNTYNARISVQVTQGGGRVAAYGSVIDNSTQDPTYVPAQ